MKTYTTADVIRRSQVLIVSMAALFGTITLVNNFTDYNSYADLIGRILNMSDTSANESRRSRAVTSTMFHHRFYWAIITLEIIFTFNLIIGTCQLLSNLNAPRNEFHEAKKFAIIGFSTALFVYQTLYVILLNEWFDLDYSIHRNVFDWARSNIEYMFFGLLYLLFVKDN
ncbi:DUF2165 family protein [Pseudomonas vancouverensis]|uniref:DUF2165 family protein n=1 Tax=Pseudomonas vancouverensis TaxID=95300 RepID=A0A1H2P8N0_PSEVA|nr:DUF2165 family protein [Pseudomonas vancouverensis]KAB0500335.1 DUF2165 domain-containing protein [Pseudomonas vancouverensis]TDB58921.1 DUF2165 family protein [Pseudomonas vancouverensis]SDV14049.1 Predicted small integral membrane protein [Pseudomonas vancouverensis]